MNFIQSEVPENSDESRLSNASVQNNQRNGSCNDSVSSDEGVFSSESEKSDTDPKTIQNEESHSTLTPSLMTNFNEEDDDFSSSLLFSGPANHPEENQPGSEGLDHYFPSIDTVIGEANIEHEQNTLLKTSYPIFISEENQPERPQWYHPNLQNQVTRLKDDDDPSEKKEHETLSPTTYINLAFEGNPPDSLQMGNHAGLHKQVTRPDDVDRSEKSTPDSSPIDITGGEENCQTRLHWKAWKPKVCFIVVIGFIVAIVIAIIVEFTTSAATKTPKVCTVTPEGHTKCQLSEDNVEAVIMNASKYVDEGNGEIIIPLNTTIDITMNNIHLSVQDGYLYYSNPNGTACSEKGTFPVALRNASGAILQTLPPIIIEKHGESGPVHIAPLVYRNLTDGGDYVILRCTVSHCDTVVTAVNLMVPGYSKLPKPMSCTHEETKDGLNTCSLTMSRYSFENSQYIQCASVLSTAESSVTIKATDDKYKEPVSSSAVLKHGQPSKIVRHVTVNENENVVLEKDDSSLQFTSGNSTASRISLSVSSTESEQIAEVTIAFSPATFFDEGTFVIRIGKGAFEIRTQVDDGPDLIPFPTTSVASVGSRLVIKSVYRIGDGAQTVTVNTLRKSGTRLLQAGSRVEFGNSDEYVIFGLALNVLELTYVKQVTECPDHNRTVEIIVQDGNGVVLLNISSRMHVNANQYRISSTGGSFQENAANKSVKFAAYLGCRPSINNVSLTINGKYDPSQTEDVFRGFQVTNDTGEMSVIKEYHLDMVTLQDNGTTIHFLVSFLDDDGTSRLLNETVTVLVVPGGFCEGKQHGCNFQHPYRHDQYVACGQDVIAAIHACPGEGQVFKPSKCTGFCE